MKSPYWTGGSDAKRIVLHIVEFQCLTLKYDYLVPVLGNLRWTEFLQIIHNECDSTYRGNASRRITEKVIVF